MSGKHWDIGISSPAGPSVGPESPSIPTDILNHEPDEKLPPLQQSSPYIVAPGSETNGSVPTPAEATEGHLANLAAEFQTHSQYFTPESRNDSEWIAWVQEALADEWSEHLTKLENFQRERVAWQKRKEDLEKQRLEECRMEVVRMWIEKQVQGWEGERKRWAGEDDSLERENALEIQTIRGDQRGVERGMGGQPEFEWAEPPRQNVDTFFW